DVIHRVCQYKNTVPYAGHSSNTYRIQTSRTGGICLVRHREFLASDLEEVKELIRESLDPNGTIVNDSSYELFQYGAKKIRPTFTLLVGRLADRSLNDDVIRAGASLEPIDMASLVHADIIDDSTLRRGQNTVYYEHAYLQAVNTGNYLLSTSLELV